MREYTSKSIQTMKGLDVVRQSPSQFLPDVDVLGQTYLWKEPIDNSIDELVNKTHTDGEQGQLTVLFFLSKDRYQILIDDNGRGIPLDRLRDSFCEMHTSGKYKVGDESAYETSSGLFGVGGKAAAGLSKQFRALSKRGREGLGDLRITFTLEEVNFTKEDVGSTGTTVILEPEPSIFGKENIIEYANGAYSTLIDLLKMYSIFSEYTIRVGVFNTLFLDNFITPSTKEICDKVSTILSSKSIAVYKTTPVDYLKSVTPAIKKISWGLRYMAQYNKAINLGFDVSVFYAGLHGVPKPISLVNYVPISDINSSHNQAICDAIRKRMVKYIEDKAIAKYFIEKYQLPIYIVANVKVSGAKFSGTTKHAFKNKQFQQKFTEIFGSMLEEERIEDLFNLISNDITTQYAKDQFGTAPKQLSNTRLLLDLKFPDKFKDCRTTDRMQAELFLLEGDSASASEGRNPETQATYSLRGKPVNAIIDKESMSRSLTRLGNNDIFHDVLRIIGLSHTTRDFSQLRYGKIMITADADSHGKHICNLLLGNFYALNPDIITSGIIHIVIPPIHALRIKGKSDIIFVYSREQLLYTYTKFIYIHALGIKLITDRDHGSLNKELTFEEYVEFTKRIFDIGEAIEQVSAESGVDMAVVEQLAYIHKYLTPTHMDIHSIRAILQNPLVEYIEHTRTLIIPIGKEDHIISLDNIGRVMARDLMHKLNSIAFETIGIQVTTKYTDLYKDTPVSIVTLYKLFLSLNTLFQIERYKGVGTMNPKERAHTCLNPKYRYTYQIKSLDDVDILFGIMGGDPTMRKKLIRHSNTTVLDKYTLS